MRCGVARTVAEKKEIQVLACQTAVEQNKRKLPIAIDFSKKWPGS